MAERESLPPPIRDHLERLTGRHGIYQHARGPVPDPYHGTCTDDVARALGVDILHAGQLGWTAVGPSAEKSLTYLEAAFDAETRRFRNFRADDGTWLDGPVSQDAQGRALLGLAATAAGAPGGPATRAVAVVEQALPGVPRLTAVRAVASASLACVALTAPEAGSAVGAVERQAWAELEALGGRLNGAFDPGVAGWRPTRGAWAWPELAVTYEAFLLPRALLAAGDRLGRDDLVGRGREVLDWLLDYLVDRDGCFHPIGNRGWWQQGGPPARFDQQPIEAGSLVAAADLAHQVTGDARYLESAEAAFPWFTGRNDLGVPVALPARGACQDGLEPDGINLNQGAESTLMWLAAVEHLRAMRARAERGLDQRIGSTWPWGSGRGQDRMYSRTAR